MNEEQIAQAARSVIADQAIALEIRAAIIGAQAQRIEELERRNRELEALVPQGDPRTDLPHLETVK